ncbi:MAG: hypothetical protein H6Q52_1368 [Deltaproteobacteria bacterium]|nr:hypothetical protein [Deltaproteobacteria bacterium]
MDSLTLNELAELLLVASYAETEAMGHTNFFISVSEIAANLGVENQSQIIDACHLLEEKGCILLAFDHATALSASITPEGEAYVAAGGETGIIGEYQRYRSIKANTSGNLPGIEFEQSDQLTSYFEPPSPSSEIPPDITGATLPAGVERDDLRHIFASLEMLINSDASLPAGQKSDLFIDLKSLELQVSKDNPRRPVIESIASDLKKLPGLAALVDLLIAKI